MAFRGLARIPRRVARRLSEAVRACAMAAAALEAAARDRSASAVAMKSAGEAERMSQAVALAAAHMFGGGIDREDVVGIARALQMFGATLEEAAFAVRLAEDARAGWDALTGVVRDAARDLAAAVDGLDGPADERDAHLDRVDELHDEWRQLVRAARAQVLTQAAEPNAALVADMALRRLENAEAACRHASRTVRTVAIKHA